MKEELKRLLEEMPRSYDDFVDYVLSVCDTDDKVNDLLDFITGGGDVNVSNVLRYTDKYDIGDDEEDDEEEEQD